MKRLFITIASILTLACLWIANVTSFADETLQISYDEMDNELEFEVGGFDEDYNFVNEKTQELDYIIEDTSAFDGLQESREFILDEIIEEVQVMEDSVMAVNPDLSEEEVIANGNCGEQVFWTLHNNGTLLISGTGGMYDYSDENPTPWVEYKEEISEVQINDGVTSIGDYAFYNCIGFSEISLPNSLISIGESAFFHCEGLTNINIPDGVTNIGSYAFSNCTGFEEIVLPKNLKDLETGVFIACIRLISVVIPEGVESIGTATFSNCRSLKSVSVPKSAKRIGSMAFWNCVSLASVKMEEGITEIGASAFMYCQNLTEIAIPEGVLSIEHDTFAECTRLATVSIPKSVSSIGANAFAYCNSLTELFISKNVTTIGNNAFPVSNLQSIVVDDENPVYDSREQCDAIIETETNKLCYSSKNTVIPISVQSIGYRAFQASDVSSVVIPKNVVSIDTYAFISCENLESIYLPKGLTSIGDSVFLFCENLKEIYYGGSEEDRAKIKLGDHNEILLNAAWHYSETEDLKQLISIHCPVDVTVYDSSGTAVAGVYDNQPDYYDSVVGEVEIVINGDEKDIYLPYGEKYSVSLVATGAGTMTYKVAVVDSDNRKISEEKIFENVKLLSGKEMFSETGDTIDISETKLYLKNLVDKVVAEIEEGGGEVFDGHTPGDINDDGSVTLKDVLWLLKYINKKPVEVVLAAVDVNGDGASSLKDVLWLLKFVNGKNVLIF